MSRVLVACEFSGVVRDAFAALGHDAWSCDLLPTETPGKHYQRFLEDIIGSGREWDLIIAHPPCTYLCNSGVCWLYNKDGSRNEPRWRQLEQAAAFFAMIWKRDCPRICVENPIMHKHAKALLADVGLPKPQIIQPWQFGHGETKATCLWLRGLPPLKPTNIVEGREQRLHRLPPSPTRAKERSRTFPGIAQAMAEQWSKLLT